MAPQSSEQQEIREQRKKRTRGRTKSKSLSIKECDRVKVQFNERGHWIKDKSAEFASFLGALVREVVPVTLSNWKGVSNMTIDDMWTFIKANYIVDDCHKDFIVRKMGSYWRQYKSSLTTDLRKIMDQGVDVKKKIADLKPPNLKDEEWVAFSKQQCSYESRVVSEKFSAMRKMQNIQHTMGRKGYARLEDEMIESNKSSMITRVDVWTRGHIKKNGQPSNATVGEKMEQLKKCSELSSNATSIKDDAITQILGPEKRGHVRGLGFGATLSKVDMQMRTNSIVKGLHEEMMVLKATCMELKTIVLQNMSMGMKPNEGHASGGDETMNVSQSFPEDSQHDNDDGYSDSHVVNKKCKLLSWMGTGEVVAEGSISSTNPHDTVHHMVLGPDFWRVWVDHVLVEGVELLRPTSEMSVLDEAVGSTIAWPSKYISSL